MKSVQGAAALFVFSVLALSGLFGAAPQGQQVQARLLDQNVYQCSNCFFGTSSYYFCFEADNKILIGYQKIPALNWKEHTSNLAERAHKAWSPWAAPGQTVPLRYDQKFIWVTRADGKAVRLRQDYATDIFISDKRCRAAVVPHV